MRLPKLEIVTGEVVNVQLTTETYVRSGPAGPARGRGGTQFSSRVLNRMRVFLKTPDGKERDFAFANSTVGVREGHRVSVVRAPAPGAREPLIILLHNHSTGQREEMAPALAKAVGQKTIPARWRALGAALVVFLLVWAVAELLNDAANGFVYALVWAFGGFFVLWGLFGALDMVLLPARERALSERLRAEIQGRLIAAEGGEG